jgi:hypothetical protein
MWQKNKIQRKNSRMAMNRNQVVIQNLIRQLHQVAMQQNEKKNVVEELQFVSDAL